MLPSQKHIVVRALLEKASNDLFAGDHLQAQDALRIAKELVYEYEAAESMTQQPWEDEPVSPLGE